MAWLGDRRGAWGRRARRARAHPLLRRSRGCFPGRAGGGSRDVRGLLPRARSRRGFALARAELERRAAGCGDRVDRRRGGPPSLPLRRRSSYGSQRSGGGIRAAHRPRAPRGAPRAIRMTSCHRAARRSPPLIALSMIACAGCAQGSAREPGRIRVGETASVEFATEATAQRALTGVVEHAPPGCSCSPGGDPRVVRCACSSTRWFRHDTFVVAAERTAERVTVRVESTRSSDRRIASAGEWLHGANSWRWFEDVDLADMATMDARELLEALRPGVVRHP